MNPAIIEWASREAGISPDLIPKKLGISPETFEKWKKGEILLPYKKLKSLASLLNIPVGYLFLEKPPEEKLPLPDLRSGPAFQQKFSSNLKEVIKDALEKQEWFKEYRLKEGLGEIPFIGRFSLNSSIKEVAQDISQTLKIEPPELRTLPPEKWFNKLVYAVETPGILVLRNSIVHHNTHRPLSPEEFRGFVLVDKIAPIIFINTRDAEKAQIFTLFHELAHLWIEKSGLTDDFYLLESFKHEVEKFCNKVAAEILLPEEYFVKEWSYSFSIEKNLQNLSRKFKVSALAVLRRAYDLNLIDYPEYQYIVKTIYDQIKKKSQKTGRGIAFIFTRNSVRFTHAVLEEVASGRTGYIEAARLLKVSWQTVARLIDRGVTGVRF